MLPSPRLESPAPSEAGAHWQTHGLLMSHGRGLPNDDALARMLATQAGGGGSLPVGLGLKPTEFASLLGRHFPGAALPVVSNRPPPAWDPRLLEEKEELIKLLDFHRAGRDMSERWMSVIVATGCMANDHLWEDLGLWSRRDLSELMARNFPTLAARNDRDMKWKKFLYKQLCEQEGVYLCRAPSCAVCRDYALCFGSEDSAARP
ncbi:MAG: nitrogen fixation protein NifQ [Candidatus Contendobacter sp.]|nr:nitrogen fixation protein NifQ [Candidatus Contendobacter sp.]MDS4057736.1 nitrogen fixation protein NifQ [Candidatus Contendobacter sp.]